MSKDPKPEKQPSPLRAEVEQLKARKEVLSTELADVMRKLDVLIPALRVLEGDNGVPAAQEPINPIELKTLTLRDAMVILARNAGGTVNVKDMGPLLQKYGLVNVKHPYQATAKAYTAMYSSNRFRKSGAGTFTLIEG